MKTPTPQKDDEMAIVTTMFTQLEKLRDTDEAYFVRFEDGDLDNAPRSDLLALMASAPNDPMRFFILGKYSTRLMCESVQRRPS